MAGGGFLKKILVPIDRSDSSVMAEEVAAKIAKKTQATVTVLHVIPRGVSYNVAVPDSVADEIKSSLEQEGNRTVNDAGALFSEEKIPFETEILREYDAADSVLEYSKGGYDLIVMGAHGENEKDPYTLGSTTKRVIMHTRTPTLITKEVSSLSSMLVCVDGSERSTKALDFAAKLAQKMDSQITLLNVQEHRLHKASPKVASELGERILSTALEAMGRQKLRVKVDKRLEVGVPSNAIVEVAEKGKYDVVVLGSKGHGRVRRFLLGSVSDDVSQKAKCSVLIVP
jgi:nucleotide-binding universal stress UspA family protein